MAGEPRLETIAVRGDDDVVHSRRVARELASHAGLRLVDQTKLITAVSELARNMTRYAGGGTVEVTTLAQAGRRGVQVVFRDEGPGIADLDLAMSNGYTTGNGLGLGLGGAKRLVHRFDIDTAPGRGTTVTVVMWG